MLHDEARVVTGVVACRDVAVEPGLGHHDLATAVHGPECCCVLGVLDEVALPRQGDSPIGGEVDLHLLQREASTIAVDVLRPPIRHARQVHDAMHVLAVVLGVQRLLRQVDMPTAAQVVGMRLEQPTTVGVDALGFLVRLRGVRVGVASQPHRVAKPVFADLGEKVRDVEAVAVLREDDVGIQCAKPFVHRQQDFCFGLGRAGLSTRDAFVA